MPSISSTALHDLSGLGRISCQWLARIGIHSRSDLASRGAVRAYLELQDAGIGQPSLNLLYAMVGALENRPWQTVAREDKIRLLNELEGLRQLRLG